MILLTVSAQWVEASDDMVLFFDKKEVFLPLILDKIFQILVLKKWKEIIVNA